HRRRRLRSISTFLTCSCPRNAPRMACRLNTVFGLLAGCKLRSDWRSLGARYGGSHRRTGFNLRPLQIAQLGRPQAVTIADQDHSRVPLTISELCEAKGWHRGRFYRWTDAAAAIGAAYLNK